MNISLCIKYLFPFITNNDFLVFADENGQQIVKWDIDTPVPTNEQLRTAWKNLKLLQYQKENNLKLLNDLYNVYTNFSDIGKAVFGQTYNTVIAHINRNDTNAAKLTIQMVNIPTSVVGLTEEQLTYWENDKLNILEIFSKYENLNKNYTFEFEPIVEPIVELIVEPIVEPIGEPIVV